MGWNMGTTVPTRPADPFSSGSIFPDPAAQCQTAGDPPRQVRRS